MSIFNNSILACRRAWSENSERTSIAASCRRTRCLSFMNLVAGNAASRDSISLIIVSSVAMIIPTPYSVVFFVRFLDRRYQRFALESRRPALVGLPLIIPLGLCRRCSE